MTSSRNLDLAVLNEISHIMVREKSVSALLGQALDALYCQMGLLRGTVTLREGDELVIEASHGLSEEERRRGHYRLGEGITGQVAVAGKARIIPDVSCEPEFLNRTGSRNEHSHVAFICVPILHQQQVIGTLSIDREMTGDADLERDFNLLEIVAGLLAEAVARLHVELEAREQLLNENYRLQQQLQSPTRPPEIIGDCPAMRNIYAMIEQVADSDATVLIRGGSGTGKELVARAIQRLGARKNRPFVVVNCAALPENLIESELFGHERGAFTGATARRIGRVEAADTGTLFLDEIGDISLPVQVKLLRFIQERTFQRVGSNHELRSDVRILAATSRDLEKLMTEGKFREDLYYRLNVFPIQVPALAERRSDILPLAEHFLEKFNVRYRRQLRGISSNAVRLMLAHSWPGNVRELENCMERAVLTARGELVEPENLPPALQGLNAPPQPMDWGEIGDFKQQVEDLERQLITRALRRFRGNVAATARGLNLSGRVLRYKIKQLAIDVRELVRAEVPPGEKEGGV